VRLGLGVIKALGEVWTIGHITVREIQTIARETLSLQKSTGTGSSNSDVIGTPEVEMT
jgi:hypothetical protein